MTSCQCVYSTGAQACVLQSSLPGFTCADTCGLQAEKDVTVRSATTISGACPLSRSSATPDAALAHLKWLVGYQGAKVWTGPESDQLLKGEPLRAALLGKESGLDSVVWRRNIGVAVIGQLERATALAISRCKVEDEGARVKDHMRWVWKDQGRSNELFDMGQRKDYPGIRSLFAAAQLGNPNVTNILYCFSGPDIKGILNSLGAPGTAKTPSPAGVR